MIKTDDVEAKGSIEILSKGSKSESFALELSNSIELLNENKYKLISKTARPFGVWETLLITIAGAISSHFVIQLIEKALYIKKKEHLEVNIELYYVDTNISFNLPEDKKKCIEHFEALSVKNE